VRDHDVDTGARRSGDPTLQWILAAVRLVDSDTPANRRFFRDIFEDCRNPQARMRKLRELVGRGVSVDILRRAWMLKTMWSEELDCGERAYSMAAELHFATDFPLSWEAAIGIVEEIGDQHDDAEVITTIERLHAEWRTLWFERVRCWRDVAEDPPHPIFSMWLAETLRQRHASRTLTRRRR
jgi:hypothetical protein